MTNEIQTTLNQGVSMSFTQCRQIIMIIMIVVFIFPQTGKSEVSVGGNYMGLINTFDVDHSKAVDPERNQFDFAVNIDFEWKIKPNIIIFTQLQGGTGGGSLGFVGPEPAVTDLNITFEFDDSGLVLVIGSFDTPFGEQTEYLTNNADSFRNPFLLNSLFYSAFGGTVGTLNTLGMMGTLETKMVELTLSLTNGTSEDAGNPDGNFEWVVSLETSAGIEGFEIAGSFMQSDDFAPGVSTDVPNGSFGSDFRGWMIAGNYVPIVGAQIKGYFGGIEYGDNVSTTKDDVSIWMGEASYGGGPWQLAVRVSGWEPDDNNGDGAGVSAVLPNPGLSANWPSSDPTGKVTTTAGPNVDQSVMRLQVGVSWFLMDDLVAKLEYVQDDYDKALKTQLGDVNGVILLLNGKF